MFQSNALHDSTPAKIVVPLTLLMQVTWLKFTIIGSLISNVALLKLTLDSLDEIVFLIFFCLLNVLKWEMLHFFVSLINGRISAV